MKKTLRDVFKLVLPMGQEKKQALELAQPYLDTDEYKDLQYYLRMDKCFAQVQRFDTSKRLFADAQWPFFKSHLELKEVDTFLDGINEKVMQQAKAEAFKRFAPVALEKTSSTIAANIVGMHYEKQAAALQLFASEPFHLLLIGDPGTGKTDILRSVHDIAPIGSFGLGSGVSGVGLSAMAHGDELLKGLLPLADGGIACIDELNLIKAKDLAALYNAMEKGFVSYDKGAKHETLPAHVRVCATANPTSQTFVGQTAEVLRKQIPFGDALLSRFHFIFIVRKPSEKEFEEIAKKIVRGEKVVVREEDAAFLKEYISFAQEIEVRVDPSIELQIVDFVKGLKQNEKKFLTEIGPRTVVGVLRVAKAVARASLSDEVLPAHIELTFSLLERALYVRKADGE